MESIMSESSRDKITGAAVELFSRDGYRGTTTRKIAARAGVNESTLFRIFESKEKLFREILSEGSNMLTIINLLKKGDGQSDIAELLRQTADLFSDMYRNSPNLIRIFMRCAMDREEMEYLENSVGPGAYKYLVSLFGNHKMTMEPEKAAFYFLSLIHGSFQRAIMFRELKEEIDTRELVDLFISGVMEK